MAHARANRSSDNTACRRAENRRFKKPNVSLNFILFFKIAVFALSTVTLETFLDSSDESADRHEPRLPGVCSLTRPKNATYDSTLCVFVIECWPVKVCDVIGLHQDFANLGWIFITCSK